MTMPYLWELAIAGASVSHGHISSYKIIHFSVQFSAVEIRCIMTTSLNSTFTNDLKGKYFFFEKCS